MSRVPSLPPLALVGVAARRWARRARRSPVAWWACAGFVGLAAFARVGAIDDEAEARRRAWGEARTVVVAGADLAVGDVIAPADVLVASWPAAVVPAGAFDEPPVGRTVTSRVVAGEAVVAARVAPAGLAGVAALIPEGHRAVALPVTVDGFGTGAPPLAVGDRVDVLATFDTYAEGEGSDADPTGVVAAAAVVVDVGESAVTVAVRERDAPRVAFAAARGTVTLALVGAS